MESIFVILKNILTIISSLGNIVLLCKNIFSPFPVFTRTSFMRTCFSKFFYNPLAPLLRGIWLRLCCAMGFTKYITVATIFQKAKMINKTYKEQLQTWDKQYLWHPFTQMQDYTKETPLIIEEGSGVFLKDVNGKEYIDGISSMWCNLHGHRKKEIDDAIRRQLDKIAHTTLLGPSNIPAIELAKSLVEIAPEGLKKVFYSDNGSTANEVALKMAFQYWQHKRLQK